MHSPPRVTTLRAPALDCHRPRSSPTAVGVPSGKEAPLGVELRLPPLDPKHSAHLCMLGALGCRDGLLAGPSLEGGLLQYGCATLERVVPPEREDADAAPSHAFGPPRKKGISALCVDHAGAVVWTGDRDGWVTGGFSREWDAPVEVPRELPPMHGPPATRSEHTLFA